MWPEQLFSVHHAGLTTKASKLRPLVDAVAKNLAHYSLEHESIALYAGISFEGILLLLAAIKSGLRVALCPQKEPAAVLGDWLSSLNIKLVVASGEDGNLPSSLQILQLKDLVRASIDAKLPRRKDFISILRTSGTTSRPKSALIEASAHWASAAAVNNYFKIDAACCFGLSLPLYHVSGLSILFRCLLSQAALYLISNYQEMLYALSLKKISHLSLVPSQLARLLDDGADLSALKAIIIGGDALPKNLRQRAGRLDLPLFESYGMTETASMIWVKDWQKPGPGEALSHAVMRVAADQEILVGGSSLFSGYVEGGGAPLKSRGLFPTGDLGQVHDEELPLVVGRKHHRIIYKGENIQAEEIERILEEHEKIALSVVIAVNSPDQIFKIIAYIKWKNHPLSELELKQFLYTRLAPFKIPHHFQLWPPHAPLLHKKPRRWLLEHTMSSSELMF